MNATEATEKEHERQVFAIKVNKLTIDARERLIAKNMAYGNSALEPVRIFSQSAPEEQILVRLDDKLSRLARGYDYADEDTIDDLIGYLFLLKIARADKDEFEKETLAG